jgi:hypothetical protein
MTINNVMKGAIMNKDLVAGELFRVAELTQLMLRVTLIIADGLC